MTATVPRLLAAGLPTWMSCSDGPSASSKHYGLGPHVEK